MHDDGKEKGKEGEGKKSRLDQDRQKRERKKRKIEEEGRRVEELLQIDSASFFPTLPRLLLQPSKLRIMERSEVGMERRRRWGTKKVRAPSRTFGLPRISISRSPTDFRRILELMEAEGAPSFFYQCVR